MKRRASLGRLAVPAAALALLGLVPAAPAAGAVRWGNQGTKWEGTRRVDYARL